jgi:predicted O-linked N-acetylglucosamine transferase (SPINDLY family)
MSNSFAEHLLDQADKPLQTRNYAAAAPLVDQALLIEPKNPRALSYGSVIAANTGRKDLALKLIGQALKLAPDAPMVIHDAALVFWECGQRHRACRLWERLNVLQPGSAETLWNLAVYHCHQDDAEAAERYFRQVMELAPRHPGLHMILGNVVKGTGRIGEAIAFFREGARLFPQLIRESSNYLYGMHFDPSYGPEQIHAEHAAWGQALEAVISATNAHHNDRSPERRLRIGYVCSHFRGHVLGYSLLPLFRQHDRSQFEIYGYSDTRDADEMTAAFRQGADVWRDTATLSDVQLAAQVSQDKIDVLVDLIMHTAGVRLGMFARKPAPIQLTWLAYPGSTGLSRMDYRFTDPVLDPPGQTDHFYTEQSIRLESIWCYEPPANSPSVRPLPAEKNGYITFGCLNSFAKINDTVLEVWREILAAIPDSRLVLVPPKGKVTERVREKLGVDSSRLIGLPRASRHEYFKNYHRIDLALDPFPYTGGITTLDSLWMGVPVVTLAGATVVSRGSLSILSNVGLTELAAGNKADYVALAVALAQDKARLRELRAGLRERLERSMLMDANRFARQIESAYRDLWRKWCGSVPAEHVQKSLSTAFL